MEMRWEGAEIGFNAGAAAATQLGHVEHGWWSWCSNHGNVKVGRGCCLGVDRALAWVHPSRKQPHQRRRRLRLAAAARDTSSAKSTASCAGGQLLFALMLGCCPPPGPLLLLLGCWPCGRCTAGAAGGGGGAGSGGASASCSGTAKKGAKAP